MQEPASSKVQAPQQARSAQTLNKVLDACDVLLADRAFEKISMQDIAREAGVSVGNLYNRFADRDALVEHITARHQRAFQDHMESALVRFEDDLPLMARIEMIADTFRSGLANLRPVFATVVTRRLQSNTDDDVGREGSDAILELAVAWLCQSGAEIHGDKAARARFAIGSLVFGLQFDLLLGTASRIFGDDYLVQAKAQAYYYLTHSGD